LRGDFGGRDNTDLAPYAFVEDKVLTGYLADKLGQDRDVDILEVHRDQVLAAGWFRCLGRRRRTEQKNQGGNRYRAKKLLHRKLQAAYLVVTPYTEPGRHRNPSCSCARKDDSCANSKAWG